MYFPLVFQVISWRMFHFTAATPTIVHSVLHVCPDWPVISIYTLRCLLSTIHACGSIQFIHLSALHPPPHPPPFTTGFVIAFIFQAIETLLATSIRCFICGKFGHWAKD